MSEQGIGQVVYFFRVIETVGVDAAATDNVHATTVATNVLKGLHGKNAEDGAEGFNRILACARRAAG